MPTIVVSAVNIVEGGTLKVLQDCLKSIRSTIPQWRVIAIVNNKSVVDVEGIEIITMPKPKRSWFRRIYTEYIELRNVSKTLNADIWLSLHDMSPFVKSGSQFVYCHNPTPFYRLSLREMWLEPKLIPFSALYSLFYRINIKSNCAVIVQQDWLRDEFIQRYRVKNVIVAHPVEQEAKTSSAGPISTFTYPSLPRAFKNFELICEAARKLEKEPSWNGRIVLTLDPQESRLTRDLFRRYGTTKGLEFVGRQDRSGMARLYEAMDCLLFPSRLETWGLPITEAKSLGKPIIAADLPYAREAVGTYGHVKFVEPNDATELARFMLAIHRQGWSLEPRQALPIDAPYAETWPQLIKMIVEMHSYGHPGDTIPRPRESGPGGNH
jgi:glycosyltransferase involved in cell wall biosynthesis